jgi:hypothetical protein
MAPASKEFARDSEYRADKRIVEKHKEVLRYVLAIGLVAAGSAVLFGAGLDPHRAAPHVVHETLPFGCRLPPGLTPAGTPCQQ